MNNEAAERLLHLIRLHGPDANAGQMEVEAKAALADERKATVERIRAATADIAGPTLRAILDAEAARDA